MTCLVLVVVPRRLLRGGGVNYRAWKMMDISVIKVYLVLTKAGSGGNQSIIGINLGGMSGKRSVKCSY